MSDYHYPDDDIQVREPYDVHVVGKFPYWTLIITWLIILFFGFYIIWPTSKQWKEGEARWESSHPGQVAPTRSW